MSGLLAVLSENGWPDEAEFETQGNQRVGKHLDVSIRIVTRRAQPDPLCHQRRPCGHVFAEEIAQPRLQNAA